MKRRPVRRPNCEPAPLSTCLGVSLLVAMVLFAVCFPLCGIDNHGPVMILLTCSIFLGCMAGGVIWRICTWAFHPKTIGGARKREAAKALRASHGQPDREVAVVGITAGADLTGKSPRVHRRQARSCNARPDPRLHVAMLHGGSFADRRPTCSGTMGPVGVLATIFGLADLLSSIIRGDQPTPSHKYAMRRLARRKNRKERSV